jgi:hypothetical protein
VARNVGSQTERVVEEVGGKVRDAAGSVAPSVEQIAGHVQTAVPRALETVDQMVPGGPVLDKVGTIDRTPPVLESGVPGIRQDPSLTLGANGAGRPPGAAGPPPAPASPATMKLDLPDAVGADPFGTGLSLLGVMSSDARSQDAAGASTASPEPGLLSAGSRSEPAPYGAGPRQRRDSTPPAAPPPIQAPAGAGSSGAPFFVPLAALLALLALAAPATRRLREVPALAVPTPYVCALERPG